MGIVNSVFDVFSRVSAWFIETLPTLTGLFWDSGVQGGDGSLTILGVMAVASIGISVTLLLFNYVKDLLTFRG